MNPQIVPIMIVSSEQLKIPVPTIPNIQAPQIRQVVTTADLFTSPKPNITQPTGMRLNGSKESLNSSFELSKIFDPPVRIIKTQNPNQKAENLDKSLSMKIEDIHEERY